MFVSVGLEVDIGGQRTGDVCRIDGHAGTVEVLRARPPLSNE
jgi:hypothetical protein